MARKIVTATVPQEGRDKGKKFLLTEMPASQAERWAMRALLAMVQSGVEIPDDAVSGGVAALARMGLQSLYRVQFEALEPLLIEMMGCVQAMPNPDDPNVVRKLVETDIEEVFTRIWLRGEVFQLHTDFLSAVSQLTPKAETLTADSSTTPTSPP